MFTKANWRLVMSSKCSNGCIHEYEDVDRGLQMSCWAPNRGAQVRIFAFRGDSQKRTFADEVSMIRAYEQAPGIVCFSCGAIRRNVSDLRLDTASQAG